ncbi:MAG: hypothetical protein BWY82_02857 [Verrucomicrobia bacterium ADurb.Bin474]|nr:MAG: hypothetical protein BWY82_02857 [Verrucomicrobia bacterium ADurb.Bin474]
MVDPVHISHTKRSATVKRDEHPIHNHLTIRKAEIRKTHYLADRVIDSILALSFAGDKKGLRKPEIKYLPERR